MVLMRPVFAEPGARAFVQQVLFGRSVGGSRVVSVDIVGPNAMMLPVAVQVNDALRQKFPAEMAIRSERCQGLIQGRRKSV